jgi:hypothetical protein
MNSLEFGLDSLDKKPKLRKMDMECIWNVRSLCRAQMLMTVMKVLCKTYVRCSGSTGFEWDRGGTQSTDEHTFVMERVMRVKMLVQVPFYLRESYQQLNGYSLLVTRCHT